MKDCYDQMIFFAAQQFVGFKTGNGCLNSRGEKATLTGVDINFETVTVEGNWTIYFKKKDNTLDILTEELSPPNVLADPGIPSHTSGPGTIRR